MEARPHICEAGTLLVNFISRCSVLNYIPSPLNFFKDKILTNLYGLSIILTP